MPPRRAPAPRARPAPNGDERDAPHARPADRGSRSAAARAGLRRARRVGIARPAPRRTACRCRAWRCSAGATPSPVLRACWISGRSPWFSSVRSARRSSSESPTTRAVGRDERDAAPTRAARARRLRRRARRGSRPPVRQRFGRQPRLVDERSARSARSTLRRTDHDTSVDRHRERDRRGRRATVMKRRVRNVTDDRRACSRTA